VLVYCWSGNVRQLRALCERWLITRAGQRLERENLPAQMLSRRAQAREQGIDLDRSMGENTREAVEAIERRYLHALLGRHEGHLGQTAESAGITRRTLYSKMKALGLEASDYREGPARGRPPRPT
jgi:two-component system response regulator AtoC